MAFNDIDYVIHAAAMKQVPACEYNPIEAIKTNINGAQNVIEASLNKNVKKVIALSTDKAVNPINLYGGTKLVSDKLFISANAYTGKTKTNFSIVRYGNVSGSRGSIIPFFKNLIKQGKSELPITDTKMTRFWMTLDDAVELVILALKQSKGGETFVYKCPSYHVSDIAKALNPNGTIKIIGIREGEKIHESMITSDDAKNTYEFDNHYIIYPNYNWANSISYKKKGAKKLEEYYEYNSKNNKHWLTVDQLKKMLPNI